MLPPGHLSASYLLAKSNKDKASQFSREEIIFIIFCGFIFDLDFFVPYLFGYPGGLHHYFPTHTPLAGIIYFVILYSIFRKKFSKKAFIFAGIAMLSHLVIDDFSYWMSLLRIENNVGPQIFWAYPFDPRRGVEINKALALYQQHKITNLDVLKSYIFQAPKLFILEIVVTISALLVFIKSHIHKTK